MLLLYLVTVFVCSWCEFNIFLKSSNTSYFSDVSSWVVFMTSAVVGEITMTAWKDNSHSFIPETSHEDFYSSQTHFLLSRPSLPGTTSSFYCRLPVTLLSSQSREKHDYLTGTVFSDLTRLLQRNARHYTSVLTSWSWCDVLRAAWYFIGGLKVGAFRGGWYSSEITAHFPLRPGVSCFRFLFGFLSWRFDCRETAVSLREQRTRRAVFSLLQTFTAAVHLMKLWFNSRL